LLLAALGDHAEELARAVVAVACQGQITLRGGAVLDLTGANWIALLKFLAELRPAQDDAAHWLDALLARMDADERNAPAPPVE
jgi:hypothetical protein